MKKKIPSFSEDEIFISAMIGAKGLLDNISKKFFGKDRALFISKFLSCFIEDVNEVSSDVSFNLEVVPK